jgi:hypothetical protein
LGAISNHARVFLSDDYTPQYWRINGVRVSIVEAAIQWHYEERISIEIVILRAMKPLSDAGNTIK